MVGLRDGAGRALTPLQTLQSGPWLHFHPDHEHCPLRSLEQLALVHGGPAVSISGRGEVTKENEDGKMGEEKGKRENNQGEYGKTGEGSRGEREEQGG